VGEGIAGPACVLVVDLSGIEFIGSVGLRTLLQADQDLREFGRHPCLDRPVLIVTAVPAVRQGKPGFADSRAGNLGSMSPADELLTVGVEEEFFAVDVTGHLSHLGAEVVESAADDGEGELQKELSQSQVELATSVCHTRQEVLTQIRDLRDELAITAARRGLRLVPSGAAPTAEDDLPGITRNPRYQRIAEHFGATATTVVTCGCHVHVDMPDREIGIHVINHVRPWLPILLAVTANSPIEFGLDTSYSSWRYQRWSQWPSAGPPPRFASLDAYESIVDMWLRSGAILDRGMVYWDIRLSDKQPTVEFRIGDVAPSPEEAVLLAVLARALTQAAVNAIDRPAPDLPNEVLRGHLWRAARDGLTGQCPHPRDGRLVPARAVLDDLIGHVTPFLRANDDFDFVKDAVSRLLATGNGADRQRRLFGMTHRPEDVVDLLALRCGYPDRHDEPT
jgi:carboxylate-amine ligase